jgi:methionyl-tRNA formyltransferase
MRVVYFGPSAEMVEILINHVQLVHVVYEQGSENIQLINMCEWHGISYSKVKTRSDICSLVLPYADVGISYGIGIIFSLNEIGLFKKGIWNIHTGELPKYRGRHPISWAMINNEKKIGVTIHMIDEEIDRGKKISSGYIQRSIDDDENIILKKILRLIDNSLLNEAINNYNNNCMELIGKGEYHKSLVGGFNEINPKKVNSIYLFNLLRSQVSHGGVNVLGENFLSGHYYDESLKFFFKDALIVRCKDGKKLGLFKSLKKL